MDDIVLIDKPAGMTSFGVVARVRRVLGERYGKKIKVGHTGTLDPFATGLMILVTGKMCKQAMSFTKLDKSYQAEIILGQKSSTGDPEGEITTISDKIPQESEIRSTLEKFTGSIKQKPPIFSAIKINGQRAYKLARDGKEVEIPVRTVNIYQLDLVDYQYPKLTIKASVSSGTYIRSLAVDIGDSLGTGAYCSQLRRLTVDKYSVADAKKLIDFGINS